MPFIPRSEQDREGEAATFIGKRHESEVSFFLEYVLPGHGPALHRHPYSETFIVLEGEITFTLGREQVVAGPGDMAVAPTLTPHKFINSGDGPARSVNIHAAAEMETEWLDEDTWEVTRTSFVRA
jgi:mannose-6-phosphate isomerase-like protein (cupin superfamily)